MPIFNIKMSAIKKAIKKHRDPQELEDKLTAQSLKRYKEKSKGVRMTRSIFG